MKIIRAILLIFASLLSATAQTHQDTAARAEAILRQMTLAEKIDYIGGYNSFYIRAIPRLGVPELKMADGPMGVRNYGPSTSFPAGIAMAASWNTDLVRQIGAAMGKDSRARGVHFLLGPGMNIYRAPMCGRNFEYFGEDPFLAARMAVADIQGIQSQGVIATAKHFLGNNQEWNRHHVSSDIDERTLREIYLPAFEASVKEAHVGAVMDSYNLLNGVHLTQSDYFNTQVLRQDWGFKGIVMSDWNATYDAVGTANGGLDLEMPSGKFMNQKTLFAAIREGKVSEPTIDEKVRRILRTAIEFGFFDRQQQDATISPFSNEGRKVALQAAREGMVLLKNNGLLPLDKSRVKTVAVIGPTAHPTPTGGGGSSKVNPFVSVSFLEGISNQFGSQVEIAYAPGVSRLSEIFEQTRLTTTAAGNTPGLVAEYFNSSELKGTPALVRTDKNIDFNWQASYAPGGPTDVFSARWTGYYKPSGSEEYRFYVSTRDAYRLFVDGKLLIESPAGNNHLEIKTLPLDASAHKVELQYIKTERKSSIALGIAPALDPALKAAREMAKKADAVVLCVGFDASNEGEGYDRTFALPPSQDQLIQEILTTNKNVAIVLTAGGNIDMSSWVDKTPALIHAWFPGQEGGTALAEILAGDVNPSGKLPASFERRWEDNATFNSYYDKNGRKRVAYTEGLFVGYRHFDKAGVKPLFPFGYGLSYTTFQYSNLKLTPSTTAGDPVKVTFEITNTGAREGAEVAQLYVSDGHSKVERPVKELKGFEKVSLRPGETKIVTLSLDRRAFSYYDVAGKKWTLDPGEFTIWVGSSSAKMELSGKVALK